MGKPSLAFVRAFGGSVGGWQWRIFPPVDGATVDSDGLSVGRVWPGTFRKGGTCIRSGVRKRFPWVPLEFMTFPSGPRASFGKGVGNPL